MFLYERFTKQGTVSEPGGVPHPEFALPSTVNWMRALALLCDHHQLTFSACQTKFSNVQRLRMTSTVENTVFEQLLLSLHHLSALEACKTALRQSDLTRMAIVSWYYGIYCAASAMIAAQDGSLQDDHAGTSNAWYRQFSAQNTAAEPFQMRVTSLVKDVYETEVEALKGNLKFDLVGSPPKTTSEAFAAACAYLSGCAKWYRERAEADIKGSQQFRALNKSDFRSKSARDLRDERLARRPIGFLHQAFRYRGKANYREALYLGYGRTTETLVPTLIPDLSTVLSAFLSQAGAFAAARLGKNLWDEFTKDVEAKRSFTLSPYTVWR